MTGPGFRGKRAGIYSAAAAAALMALAGCKVQKPPINLPPSAPPRFSGVALPGDKPAPPRPAAGAPPTASATPAPPPVAGAAASIPPRFPLSAGYVEGTDFEFSRMLAPGVSHRFESRADGPMTFNALTFDPSRADLVMDAMKGGGALKGRESVPKLVERSTNPESRVLAAINADFFDGDGTPIGMYVDDGMIWKHPWAGKGDKSGKIRSVFAFGEHGESFIGIPIFTMALRDASGGALEIDKANLHEGSSYATIYTWPFGSETAPIREGQSQIMLNLPSGTWLPNDSQTVTVTRVDKGPTAPLTRTTAVIHADDPLPPWIREGAELTLEAKLANVEWKVAGVIGGLPLLIKEGVADPAAFGEQESVGKNFVTDRHPRTAVGKKANGELVWLVVDGRQSRRSIGINLPDLAAYMAGLGCTEAINLDGGGSTTMWTAGEVVNFPSDLAGPRGVGNAVALRRTAPLGPVDKLVVIPSGVVVPTGSSVDFFVSGVDASGEAAPLRFGYGFATKGKGIAITSDFPNRMRFTSAGERTITMTSPVPENLQTAGGIPKGEARITAEDAAELHFTPERLLLDPGETEEVVLHAKRKDGSEFFSNFLVGDLDVPAFVEYDPAQRTVHATSKGSGRIVARLGALEAVLSVASGELKTEVVYTFDQLPAADAASWIEGTSFKREGTKIELDTATKEEGPASWKWTYAMGSGGTTKIALPVEAVLPGDPLEAGVWVYGDGQRQWLRGEMTDSAGNKYYLDFTTSAEGIGWKDEWKFVRAAIRDAKSVQGGGPAPVAPVTVNSIYLVQPQEAAKRDGVIWVDGLSAVNFPQ